MTQHPNQMREAIRCIQLIAGRSGELQVRPFEAASLK
jgi:hypothetical protein